MAPPASEVPALEIRDLHVSVENHEILRGVSLQVEPGALHALMGPNGSGKSTLANTLLANPAYVVTSGRILLQGEDITALPTDERAQRGLFLGFQHPEATTRGARTTRSRGSAGPRPTATCSSGRSA